MLNTNELNIVAEIAQYHDGSLGRVYALIDALSNTGVSGIKFQIHNAEFESSKDEPWRVEFSKQDDSRYNYWKRVQFDKNQWKDIRNYVKGKKLDFICSPFSIESAKMMFDIGVDAWKIASGELTNVTLLNYLVQTKLPIICSTGMSNWAEIDQVYDILKETDLIMVQCTSKYPTRYDEIGINVMNLMKEKYNIAVGLSDHSGSITPSIISTVLGANYLEFHVCFSKEDYGSDVSSSLTIDEIKLLMTNIKAIKQILDNPVDKDFMSTSLSETRFAFNKSICLNKQIEKDAVLSKNDLMCIKPAKGISASYFNQVVGKKVNRTIKKGEFLNWCDIYE